MSAAEDMGPSTSRSGASAESHEKPVRVDSARPPISRGRFLFEHMNTVVRKLTAKQMPVEPRMVLTVMVDHANSEGVAWPSVETIASMSGVSEATARRALRKLVQHGWLTLLGGAGGGRTTARYRVNLHGCPLDTPVSGTTQGCQAATPGVSEGVPRGAPRIPDPHNDPHSDPHKKTPVARVPAGARVCETRPTTMTMSLFGEPEPEALPPATKKPRAARAPKPAKEPPPPAAPKAAELYSAAYVAGQTDAEPGSGFRPLGESDCRMIGMAAAAHAKDPSTGEPITGEALLAWIRKTSAAFRRATEPAFSKGYAAHAFATWLDSGRPKTRKVPLPLPPEPARPKREPPPPEPIPEMFMKLAEEDEARGVIPPFLRHRRPQKGVQ